LQDIRDTIAKNIYELRSNMKITQSQLAESLNYSDKAVSKWERGESVPDVSVLKQIADFFGVTVDYLLCDEHSEAESARARYGYNMRMKKRITVTALAFSVVWLLATVIFVEMNVVFKDLPIPPWLIFIYAVPISALILRIFNAVWGFRSMGFIFDTVALWTTLLSVYLTSILVFSWNFWLVFIIGVPLEVIILLAAALSSRMGRQNVR